MRCVVACTLAVLTAALAASGAAPASAETEGDDPAPAEAGRDGPTKVETGGDTAAGAHLLLFSGADIWRNGAFMHGGFLYAYQGLDQDGPVFKLLLNAGFYRYRSGSTDVTGRQLMAAALPGWRWNRPGLDVTVFVGLDLQDHRYTPDDPGNRLRGIHFGVRGGFDVWYEPLRDGMMAGSASLSTLGRSYWTRAAAGWRFFEAVWFGPEFLASGDDRYRQLRFGAHLTSLRMGSTEWSAGAGWVTDSDRRDGVYGRIGVLVRR